VGRGHGDVLDRFVKVSCDFEVSTYVLHNLYVKIAQMILLLRLDVEKLGGAFNSCICAGLTLCDKVQFPQGRMVIGGCD